MTMIRINLIAERKSAGAKGASKSSSEGPSNLEQQINEFGILLMFLFAAIGIVYYLGHSYTKKVTELRNEKTQLDKEFKKLEKWEKMEEQLQLEKLVLLDKIDQISNLENQREESVRLMEDVYNAMSPQVWLIDLYQGVDANLVQASVASFKAFDPKVHSDSPKDVKLPTHNSATSPQQVQIFGMSRSTDAASNMVDNIQNMDTFYNQVNLNYVSRDNDDGPYIFEMLMRIKPVSERVPKVQSDAAGTESPSGGSTP